MNKTILKIALQLVLVVCTACSTQKVKKYDDILQPYIPDDGIIHGDIMVFDFTLRFKEILRKIQRNAKTNFSWYIGYIVSNKPEKPLPYDPKLGISISEHYYVLKWRNRKVLTKTGTITIRVIKQPDGIYTFNSDLTCYAVSNMSVDVIKKQVTTPDGVLAYYYKHNAMDENVPPWKGILWSNRKREQWKVTDDGDDPFEFTTERSRKDRTKLVFSIGKISQSSKGIIHMLKKIPESEKQKGYNYYIIYPLQKK